MVRWPGMKQAFCFVSFSCTTIDLRKFGKDILSSLSQLRCRYSHRSILRMWTSCVELDMTESEGPIGCSQPRLLSDFTRPLTFTPNLLINSSFILAISPMWDIAIVRRSKVILLRSTSFWIIWSIHMWCEGSLILCCFSLPTLDRPLGNVEPR